MNEIINKTDSPRLNLKSLRYFLFAKKTEALEDKKVEYKLNAINFTKKEGTKICKEIEAMDHFDGWSNFGETWDVLWVGLYLEIDSRKNEPKDVYWKPGFFGSDRKLVEPLRLVNKNTIGRMETTFQDNREVMGLEIPDHLKRFMMSMDRDALETQMIGEKLSGGDEYAQDKKAQIEFEKKEQRKRELLARQREIAEELKKDS
jgi:hypothetical protein